jgi:gluconolactonase
MAKETHHMKRILGFLLLLALPATVLAQEQTPIPGIGPTGKIVKLQGGFKFTEGPAGDADGNVYFSDIPAETIYKVDAKGKIAPFIEKSNRANGLMLSGKGELLACEMSGQLVAYNLKTKERRVVAGKYDGNSFNAPNDLVIDKHGGVYFTDPSFGAPKKKPQDKMGVYYAGTDGKVTRLVDDLTNPNGVKLSPDEKTLYVIPTGPVDMMAYPVEAPGKIGKGRVFCALKGNKNAAGGDGMTVDEKGNLYITSSLGLQVFDPAGKALGIITLPEQPANVTFGGPGNNTLYVTARTSVYTVPMEVKGHAYPAGK